MVIFRGYSLKKITSDRDDMVTRNARVRRVQNMKFFFLNRIENLVLIILGRFPINKTQKWRF
jgi:hypothetical protein